MKSMKGSSQDAVMYALEDRVQSGSPKMIAERTLLKEVFIPVKYGIRIRFSNYHVVSMAPPV